MFVCLFVLNNASTANVASHTCTRDSGPGPSFSVPPWTNDRFIINLAWDSTGCTCSNEYQIEEIALGWIRAGNYFMQPDGAVNHLRVFVFSSICSHCFTDAVCRTHHFLQPLPQMQGQDAKASQVSLSGSPLFSVQVMDFSVYLLFMLCLLSQCTGRTHTHTLTLPNKDNIWVEIVCALYNIVKSDCRHVEAWRVLTAAGQINYWSKIDFFVFVF